MQHSNQNEHKQDGLAALQRTLAKGDERTTYAVDAERIASTVRRYWGDEAAHILRMAAEIAERAS